MIKHFYQIENGLPLVFEDRLYKCGCGGNPQVYFVFDYENEKFTDVSVICKECNMQTPIVDNIDTAIEIWQNAFETTHYHNEWCRFDDDDRSLGGFHGDD